MIKINVNKRRSSNVEINNKEEKKNIPNDDDGKYLTEVIFLSRSVLQIHRT